MPRVQTNEFRLAFNNMFKPVQNKLNGRTEYDLVMLFDSDEQVEGLKAVVSQMIKDTYGDKKPANFKSPFRRGVQVSEDNPRGFDLEKNPAYAGKIVVKADSQYPPQIVGPDAKAIVDPTQVYSGMYGRAELEPSIYEVNGGIGLKFYLLGFQKTRDGEPFRNVYSAEKSFQPFTAGPSNNSDILDL